MTFKFTEEVLIRCMKRRHLCTHVCLNKDDYDSVLRSIKLGVSFYISEDIAVLNALQMNLGLVFAFEVELYNQEIFIGVLRNIKDAFIIKMLNESGAKFYMLQMDMDTKACTSKVISIKRGLIVQDYYTIRFPCLSGNISIMSGLIKKCIYAQ